MDLGEVFLGKILDFDQNSEILTQNHFLFPHKIDYKDKKCPKIIHDVEKISYKIFHKSGWGGLLSKEVKADLFDKRPYNFISLVSLLRAIRNKYSHFGNLSDELKQEYCSFGSKATRNPNETAASYIKFWLVKLPAIVIQTWVALLPYQNDLACYYPEKSLDFKFCQNQEHLAENLVDLPRRILEDSKKYDKRKEKKKNLEIKQKKDISLNLPEDHLEQRRLSNDSTTSHESATRKPAYLRLREERENVKNLSRSNSPFPEKVQISADKIEAIMQALPGSQENLTTLDTSPKKKKNRRGKRKSQKRAEAEAAAAEEADTRPAGTEDVAEVDTAETLVLLENSALQNLDPAINFIQK